MKSNSSSSGHKLIPFPYLLQLLILLHSDAIDAAPWLLNTETKHHRTLVHYDRPSVCTLQKNVSLYTLRSSSIRSLIISVSQSLLLLKMYSATQQLFNTHTELLITYFITGAIREVTIMGCDILLDNETLPYFSPSINQWTPINHVVLLTNGTSFCIFFLCFIVDDNNLFTIIR